MRYDPRQIEPGKYGYRCRHCANLAFAFPGEEMPEAGTFIEDCEVAQRGPHASVRRSKHICQHCAAPVTGTGGMLKMTDVVQINRYSKVLEARLNAGRVRSSKIQVTREYMGVARTKRASTKDETPAPKEGEEAGSVDEVLAD